ncbi:hypothetical protein CNMCM7691_004956 [Aspergillus felis]|uniref:Chitin biosynthesis protein (Chs5) n=1 Tax=Aspergillus felis TaxID=1287682 RepID=A0A8H6VAR3_9EURO|nr:hypothetical protein CNMCM7691_004956 [Aspergillus felis]
MIGQPLQRKLVKGTSQFYMRYNPKTVLPPVANRYILSETHPIRPKIQHMYANRDPNTLWWRVNPQPLQSFKRVVRSWATRRVRLAFRQALTAQGFDVEGRRLVSETAGSAAMRSPKDGLQGSLEIAVLPQSVKVGYDTIEFPSVLLPNNITSGSIVDITVSRNHAAEAASTSAFQALQKRILNTYGVKTPAPPILRLRNATQTSLVLEWDPIDLATASLKSLSLYRNGSKAGSIPRPLETRSTKISGLAIDTEYSFHLVLRTTAGTYQSEKLTCRTHKMTDLSGITVTPGILPEQQKEALAAALERIGGKLIDTVRIDTTHFVCTEGRGPLWEKAVEMNIPVVVPEWVDACEAEGTIVGVRGYYLNADPKARQLGPIHASTHQHTRSSVSMATNAPSQAQSQTQSQSQPQSQSQSRLSLQPQPAHQRELSVGEPPVTPFPGADMSGQPRADEREVSSDEEDLPPPPPPKDDAADAEPTLNGKPEYTSPAEVASPVGNEEQSDEKHDEKDEDETAPEQAEEEQEQEEPTTNDSDAKGKGKEGEGDFSEISL